MAIITNQTTLCEKDLLHITIVGSTGAVGAYLATKLAGHAHLSIVGRKNSPHLAQIQKEGLCVLTPSGTMMTPGSRFSYIGWDYAGISQEQDAILVSLKQPDITANFAKQILRISSPDTPIIFIGNGVPFFFMRDLGFQKIHIETVDQEGSIAKLFSSRYTLLLHPIIAANIESCGVVKISRPEDKIKVTLATTSGPPPKNLLKLQGALTEAGINTEIAHGQAPRIILEKLQFALSVNVLSGLLNKPLGDIFYAPRLQPLMQYLVTIVGAIGDAFKVRRIRNYEQFAKVEVTRTHFSSFYRDLLGGKTTEACAFVESALELANYIQSQKLGRLPDLSPLLALKELVDMRVDGAVITEESLQGLLNGTPSIMGTAPQDALTAAGHTLLPPLFARLKSLRRKLSCSLGGPLVTIIMLLNLKGCGVADLSVQSKLCARTIKSANEPAPLNFKTNIDRQ